MRDNEEVQTKHKHIDPSDMEGHILKGHRVDIADLFEENYAESITRLVAEHLKQDGYFPDLFSEIWDTIELIKALALDSHDEFHAGEESA